MWTGWGRCFWGSRSSLPLVPAILGSLLPPSRPQMAFPLPKACLWCFLLHPVLGGSGDKLTSSWPVPSPQGFYLASCPCGKAESSTVHPSKQMGSTCGLKGKELAQLTHHQQESGLKPRLGSQGQGAELARETWGNGGSHLSLFFRPLTHRQPPTEASSTVSMLQMRSLEPGGFK